jgi:hypothetical protein
MQIAKSFETGFMCNQTGGKQTWGFRFSAIDALALAAFGALAAGLSRIGSSLWWMVVIVAAHFFLFCNVFRVARRRELLWAAVFILNVATWLLSGRLDWFNVMACQLPVTTGVIAWEIKNARYHGIFADHFNANLKNHSEEGAP